eukprot:TRINITY_DN14174_c0_g1_i4.p1 TRINITY_DN14174_c0_g1~~TRINITY_DN14174_c0_g1_i4.p1  ORF type:complete len:630 (+),score=158.07 TRINITY_DN14174_c0_g1_i4:568-2457(+)
MSPFGPTQWSSTIIVSTASVLSFKFMKKKGNGYGIWETFEGNRQVLIPKFSESVFEAGVWNEKPASNPSTSQPVPPPTHTQHSVHVGGGVMMTGPSTGSKPVSKFFQTGPAQRGPSPNAIGTGPTFHSPSSLAPAVGMNNDVSDVQGHARNQKLYQAPFLPPPIFSNNRFVMYALFSSGALPTNTINISATAPDGGPLDIDVPITKLSTVGKTLHVLAARALIRDLEEGTSHLHWRKTNVHPSKRGGGGGGGHHWFGGWISRNAVGGTGQDRGSAYNLEPVTPPAHLITSELIDLGVRFGIVSRATSFIAVERWRDGHSGASYVPLPPPSQAPVPTTSITTQNMQSSPASAQRRSGTRAGPPPVPTTSITTQNMQSSPASAQCRSVTRAGPPPAHTAQSTSIMDYCTVPNFSNHDDDTDICVRSFRRKEVVKSEKACQPTRDRQVKKASSMNCEMDEDVECNLLESIAAALPPPPPSGFSFSSAAAAPPPPSGFSFPYAAAPPPPPPSSVTSLPPVPNGPPPTTLFMQQKFDGSFEITDKLCQILQVTPQQLRTGAVVAASKVGQLPYSSIECLWVSIYVLAMLVKWWSGYEELWEMCADKTRNWCLDVLKKSIGNQAKTVLDELIALI